MIWESSFWKADLLRRAAELRKRRHQRVWREESFGRLEQLLMIGFYAVRKLAEARKLTVDVLDTTVSLGAYQPRGKAITLLNWHKIEQLYDLGTPKPVQLGLVELCNQFVHSYVFVPIFEGGLLSGVLIASDRRKRRELLYVGLVDVIDVFQNVGNDDPREMRAVQDPRTGEYDVALRVARRRLTRR